MAHDFEDRLDAAAGYVWQGALKHGWDIGDRLFKIASWTLIVGALEALRQRTGNDGLLGVVTTLGIFMLIAVFATVLNVMIHFQEKLANRIPESVSYGWQIVIMFGVNSMLIAAGFWLVFPAIVLGVESILDAVVSQ